MVTIAKDVHVGMEQSIQGEPKPFQESESVNKPEVHSSIEEGEEDEGEDSEEEDVNEDSEKELETLIINGYEGMHIGVKEKEHTVGTAENVLIKTVDKTSRTLIDRSANKTGAQGTSTTQGEDPTGLVTFLEGYGITEPMQDLGFSMVSKIIINKTVGEVPERYQFIIKVATTFAVKQALAALTGGATGIGMNMVDMKLDHLKKQLEEVNKKLDIIIEEPMKTAGDHFLLSLIHI